VVPLTAGEEKIGILEIINKIGALGFSQEEHHLCVRLLTRSPMLSGMLNSLNIWLIYIAGSARVRIHVKGAQDHWGLGPRASNTGKQKYSH